MQIGINEIKAFFFLKKNFYQKDKKTKKQKSNNKEKEKRKTSEFLNSKLNFDRYLNLFMKI